jgi:MFS family permease
LLLLAALGVFFAADDQTSVVAVLPQIVDDVGLAQDQFYRAAWIVNGYILGYVVAMPLIGRIADLHGRPRVYAASMALFVAGSVWVALSTDLTVLTIGRAVQAIGAGAVVPVAMALVVDTVAPERRAFGLGAIAAASEAGGLIGPLWGGGIADLAGWRATFWLNLPLCLPIALAMWRLASTKTIVRREPIDLPGAALLAASLVALTVALTNDPIEPRPLGVTLALYAASAVALALFVLRQTRTPAPLVRLVLLRQRPIAAGLLVSGLVGGALIVAMVNVPLFTNTVLGDSALDGGLNLMRLTVALPVGALVGGMLTHRAGNAVTAGLGLVCAAAGFFGMATWDDDPGFVLLTAPLLLAGLGFGIVIAPVNTAVLDAVGEAERATVASLLTVLRLLGALVGVALLTTRGLSGFYAEAARIPLDDPRFRDRLIDLEVASFQDTFIAAGAVCLATLLPALWLGWRRMPEDIAAAV